MTEIAESRLSERQETALALVLGGASDVEVGKKVGVTRQTIWEWRNRNPDFIAELNRRRRALWHAQEERLRSLASRALAVLEEHLNDPETPPHLRQSAAVHILRAVGLYGGVPEPVDVEDPQSIRRRLQGDEALEEALYSLSRPVRRWR